MTDLLDRIRAFSYARQRLGRSGTDPLTVLHDLVGIYATAPTATLTLAARLPDLAPQAMASFDAERSAVRVPAMRSSSHLIPTDTVDRVLAATIRPRSVISWIWRGIGLDDAAYDALAVRIERAASGPITARQLRDRIDGLPDHPQAPTLLIRALRSEGRLVALAPAGLRSNAFAYVATEAWLGRPLGPTDPDGALVWLAGEYLRAYGPARIDDFRWWAGVPADRATAAVAAHETVDLGAGLRLLAADRPVFEATRPIPEDAIDLLPLWDMLTMGHAPDGRDRIVDPIDRARLYDQNGNGLGAVLLGGRAVGTWGLRFVGRRMEVDLEPFSPLSPAVQRVVEQRLDALGSLLGASAISIDRSRPRGPGGGAGRGRDRPQLAC